MRVVEIFNSIEGEGLRAGALSTFIRLAGCNLRCSYCDTSYARSPDSGQEMNQGQILEKLGTYRCNNITLTGGEPLLYAEGKKLALDLCRKGYAVNVETNGSLDISFLLETPESLITLDYKTPSSGFEPCMLTENIGKLRDGDVLKFVVTSEDLPRVAEVLKTYPTRAWVYLSPVFGKINPVRIVDFMKSLGSRGICMNKIRVQLQLHKYIWDPDRRGV